MSDRVCCSPHSGKKWLNWSNKNCTFSSHAHPNLLVTATKHLVVATKHSVVATKHLVVATKHLVVATKHLVNATKRLVTTAKHLVTTTKTLVATIRKIGWVLLSTKYLVGPTKPILSRRTESVAKAERPLRGACRGPSAGETLLRWRGWYRRWVLSPPSVPLNSAHRHRVWPAPI